MLTQARQESKIIGACYDPLIIRHGLGSKDDWLIRSVKEFGEQGFLLSAMDVPNGVLVFQRLRDITQETTITEITHNTPLAASTPYKGLSYGELKEEFERLNKAYASVCEERANVSQKLSDSYGLCNKKELMIGDLKEEVERLAQRLNENEIIASNVITAKDHQISELTAKIAEDKPKLDRWVDQATIIRTYRKDNTDLNIRIGECEEVRKSLGETITSQRTTISDWERKCHNFQECNQKQKKEIDGLQALYSTTVNILDNEIRENKERLRIITEQSQRITNLLVELNALKSIKLAMENFKVLMNEQT